MGSDFEAPLKAWRQVDYTPALTAPSGSIPGGPVSDESQPLELLRDRSEAGLRLAELLVRFKDEHPVILALPRGGVPVGCEIARRLGASLDVFVVR